MTRFFPEVRALCERVRRPARQIEVLTLEYGRAMREIRVRELPRRIAAAVREFRPREVAARAARAVAEFDIRDLPEMVRQPVARVVLALALAVPAGAFLMLSGKPVPEAGEAAAAAAQGSAGGASPELSFEVGPGGDPAVARAWGERVLEREARTEVNRLMRTYRDYRVGPALAQRIHGTALQTGIDPDIAFGLVRVESSFRRSAVSWAGAVGYTQVLPSTARWIVPGTSRTDLFDTNKNLHVGFTYLRYLLDKYDDNVRLALTAYNRGPGTVDRLLRQGRNPDNGYAGKVLSRRS